MKVMTIRRKGRDEAIPVYDLLPSGKCSNCNHPIMRVEGDWVTVDNELHKIHGKQHFYKCPQCKKFVLTTK